MTQETVKRWYPVPGLTERPATIFDISWQGGEQRLITTVRYATNAGEDDGVASAVLIFEDVFAFNVFDEYMDLSGVTEDDAVLLRQPYPYGGRWPYLEVHTSDWVRRLTEQDGAWSHGDLRHLVITTRNMHLHVACRTSLQPTYHSSS